MKIIGHDVVFVSGGFSSVTRNRELPGCREGCRWGINGGDETRPPKAPEKRQTWVL